MDTITIPKRITKNDDLVVVPRREYERVLRFWESAERITARQKKAIHKGFHEITQGKFFTSKQVKHELGI
ncbi:MAG: hypothetical protein HYX22_03190 [Candidatus Yanofskybacteria bacterium]|nr:hypothetical protein [Candidatus Yanofskybacteria bacterium]